MTSNAKKLLNFILTNKSISLDDDSLFNRDTLIALSNMINDKIELTKEQEEELIKVFLSNNNTIDSNTPEIISSNIECINKSIGLDIESANYIEWAIIKREDYNELINKIIGLGYVLSENSPITLKTDVDIAYHSIKKDIHSLDFVDKKTIFNKKIIRYMITNNNFEFSKGGILNMPLECCEDKNILKYIFNKFNIFSLNNEEYSQICKYNNTERIKLYTDRVLSLYVNAIKSNPTIKTFNNVCELAAEKEWDDAKKSLIPNNIFRSICDHLKNSENYDNAISHIKRFDEIQDILGTKSHLLDEAMRNYHRIIHSQQKIEAADKYRDQISSLIAHYISIVKENYKSTMRESFYYSLSQIFIPRKDNPIVYKKLMVEKVRNYMYELYQSDKNDYLDKIIETYSKDLDENIIRKMLDGFILNNHSKLNKIIKAPKGYNAYNKYKEALKLINRLNSKFIKYDDPELNNYTDIIKYDDVTNKYSYDGLIFDEKQISRFNKYNHMKLIFEKIKKQIIVDGMKLFNEEDITYDELCTIQLDVPFTDEFYEFDKMCKKDYVFDDLTTSFINIYNQIPAEVICNDEIYKIINDYIINNGIIWLSLVEMDYTEFYNKESFLETIYNMDAIVSLAKMFNYDINDCSNIDKLKDLAKYADAEDIAILGSKVIEKLIEDNRHDSYENILTASELVSNMVKKTKSTVPYVNGNTESYNYSLYDPLDESILLCGIETRSCFKIDSTDNDFLHYCALNKNGFVIKITDSNNNLVARASGFRNGNCVFINQLRTIYDKGDYGFDNTYSLVKEEIIKAFKKACHDMVQISQSNNNEQEKIDYVFVTKSYVLEKTKSNVSKQVEERIGKYPMVNNSPDWKEFVIDTENLTNTTLSGFTTDYGNYSLICVATSKRINSIKPNNIILKDVDAVYKRKRNDAIYTKNPEKEVLEKINRIRGLNTYYNMGCFKPATFTNESSFFLGDNWYIICENNIIVDSCALYFDKDAQEECATVLELVENCSFDKIDKIKIKISMN